MTFWPCRPATHVKITRWEILFLLSSNIMTKRFVWTNNTTWTWYYIKTKFRNSLFVQQVHWGPILASTEMPFAMFFFSGECWGLQKFRVRHLCASRAMCPKQYESIEKKPTDVKRRQQRTWEKWKEWHIMAVIYGSLEPLFLIKMVILVVLLIVGWKEVAVGERIVFIGQ